MGRFDDSYPAYTSLFAYLFALVEMSLRTPIRLIVGLGSVHSGAAS